MNTDNTEHLRVYYENAVKQNPSNLEAVHYLAGTRSFLQSFFSFFFFGSLAS